jgi:hypothetical protein
MKVISIIILILLTTSCASLDKGKPQLRNDVKKDYEDTFSSFLEKYPNANQGRPIYIHGFSGSQFLQNGDVWLGGEISIYIGREKLSLDDVIKR